MKKFWLAALMPWMALTAAWGQDAAVRPENAQAVRIQFTYFGASSDEGARVGDEVFAPPSLIRGWGWDVVTRYSDADISIDDRTLRVKMIVFKGRPMVSLTEAAQSAGARVQWSQDGTTYMVRSWIRNIELTPEGIRLDGTLPVRPKTFKLDGPSRFVIDLEGADFDPQILSPLPQGWRAGQLDENTVRVVVEHPLMARQPITRLGVGRTIAIPLMSVNAQAVPSPAPVAGGANPTGERGTPTGAIPKGAPTAKFTGLQADFPTPEALGIMIPIKSGRAGTPVGTYRGVTTLSIRIPNSSLDQDAQLGSDISPLIESVKLREVSGNATEVLVQMKRPLGFEFSNSADGVRIRLFVPPMAIGGLSGKTIVIDPGHGGNDPGAMAGGANEKGIVLKLSRFLTEELQAEGVNVITTRSTDVFVPLPERPAVANRSGASLFVSIHVNSNTVANTASGSKMFFHKRDPLGMLLATALDQEFGRLDKIPSKGTWSDTRIYKSGFAVLRGAKMPSVLIETGFINTTKDRAILVTESYQRMMAKAIVKAIKVFMGLESGE